jgi:hypothetical protein
VRFDRSFGDGLAVYGAVVLILVAVTFVLSRALSAPLERTFLIVSGVFVLAGAYVRPWWFWEHVDGWLLRTLFGDRAALVVFVLTGLALLYFGVFADLPTIG